MTEPAVPASDIHPDVLDLAQKISDKTADLLDAVESQDNNTVKTLVDEVDALNSQLQNLLIEPKKSGAK